MKTLSHVMPDLWLSAEKKKKKITPPYCIDNFFIPRILGSINLDS